MATPTRLRRMTLCGVPVTLEFVLRVVLLALTVGVLGAASMPKIRSILQLANVVSVQMDDGNTNILMPGMFVCGNRMDSVDVEALTRGQVFADGTAAPDVVRNVSSSLYQVVDATSLGIHANGDWKVTGKCVVLKPGGLAYQKNLNGTSKDAIDTIIFVVHSKTPITWTEDDGLSIAVWDGTTPMVDQPPLHIGIPSVNALTFVYSEHIPIRATDDIQRRYVLQKQNLRMMQPSFYGNTSTVIGRVLVSPDTYATTKYLDKQSYTWIDLAGAIGGMASIALAFWIFLFGSGKYKSWGVMQRYILQTSPNSKRFRDSRSPSPPKGFVENAKHLVKMQLLRLDSSADHDMDHVPLKSSAAQTHARRLSTRYSAGVNPNLNTDAVAAAAAMSSGAPRNDDNRGSKEDYDPTARYSMVSDGYNNFYFTEQGTPRTQALQPLAPINDNEDDSEVQVNELIQLIDLRIDERMWSLERTLARYYLDGFRLRNYSKNYDPYQTEQPLQDEKEQQQQQQQQEQRATKDEESGASHSGPGGSGYGAGRTDSASTAVELLQDNNNASHPGPSSPPLYPPRPKVTTPFKFAGDPSGANTGPGGYGMAPPALASRPHLQGSTSQGSTSQGMANEILASSNVPDNGFPPRKNIRGTIRRAVERLQNEWPQDLSAPPLPTQPYVPRTQYQGRPNQGGNGGNQSYSLPPPPPQY